MSTASLYTLPIELLHRIIDYTDTETIFFSFRNVCKRFYTIVNTYTQYQLDFRSITKPTFHLMRHRIQPENVISLIISDEHKTPLQIDLFISLFDISSFTRLRSLTLIQINESNLMTYLQHVNTCSLVSLSIAYRNQWKSTDATNDFLSSFFEKVNNLRKLDLKINGLIINNIRWPKQCSVRHLSLTLCSTNKQISDILLYFPQLETLILNDIFEHDIGKPVSTPVGIKSKVKSLTIEGYPTFMNTVISILSFTPRLIHLKLIGWLMMSDFSWDGYWWAGFIQNNLAQLRIFEFFFEKQINYKDHTYDIESIMTPFRTPFWLEKRWYVACDYYKNTHKLKLYSIPICKSTILYECISSKISSSNSTHDISNMMDNVHSLHLSMIPATGFTCDKSLLPNQRLFSRVTEVTIVITNQFSNGSIDCLSTLIDFSLLDTLSLTLDLCQQSLKNILTIINNLLDRVCNIQSIKLHSPRYFNPTECIEAICSMLSNRVKHLTVDSTRTDQVQLILDRLENFSSITFRLTDDSRPQLNALTDKLTKNGRDFIFHEYAGFASFWFGKQKINH